MSYQVLARKWRPANFHEMKGQEHVLQALINALDSDRLHHAYLFTGTRGVGKTSVARILAKCLNCEQGVSSRPCGECGACQEISENRFVDLIEVDAASRTKVEDTRELLENVQYAPSKGRFKIYLIDEVHMLSTHSFNALLKTLEEPPPHVKFLLATTDPQRLPATILSRCLQFSLKNLSPEAIVEHLQSILGAEQVAAEDAALWTIARAAAGSMRDALSLTDQAIAFGAGSISEEQVRAMLGSIDRDSVCRMLEALQQRDTAAVLALSEQITANGIDLEGFIAELQSSLHTVALLQAVPDYQAEVLEHAERLRAVAAGMQAEDVQLYYQIALQAQRDLPFAPDARTGLEMALLRMLTFLPAAEAEAASDAAAAATTSGDTAAEKKKTEPLAASSSIGAAALRVAQPAAAPEAIPEPDPEPDSRPEPELPAAQAGGPAGAAYQPEQWIELFSRLELGGMARNVAANCELRQVSGDQWLFYLDEDNCKLFQAAHVQQLQAALHKACHPGIQVQLEHGQVSSETPYLYDQRRKRERQQSAVDSIMSDPNVNALLDTFGGQVDPARVQPAGPAQKQGK